MAETALWNIKEINEHKGIVEQKVKLKPVMFQKDSDMMLKKEKTSVPILTGQMWYLRILQKKVMQIKIDIDGNKNVEVDPTLFDVRSGESHAQTIARIIKDRFNNLISVNGQNIQINKTTNDEWRRSKSVKHFMKHDLQTYNDKLTAIANVDELLRIAKNWIGEEISHQRTDDIIEFARGEVSYKVDVNGYSADVIVGIRKNGTAVLYDINNIYTKKITAAPVTMASKNSQRSAGATIDDIISQQNDNVNIKLSLQETAQAGEVKEKLIQENDNLRVANKLLKSEMQLPKGRMIPFDCLLKQ